MNTMQLAILLKRFKPCYKWNTFNTEEGAQVGEAGDSFKPCYKWNTFNTFRFRLWYL